MRRRRAVMAGALVAVLLVVTGAAVWWSQDRPAIPHASVPAPQAIRPPADPAALQRQLDGVVETGAPGVVALVRSGPRTWQGASGLGDLRANRPARAGERFRIGSVSKSFVATVALQLVGEGTLGLDDHLERWLPGTHLGQRLFDPPLIDREEQVLQWALAIDCSPDDRRPCRFEAPAPRVASDRTPETAFKR